MTTSALPELLARMAVDTQFAHDVQAEPGDLATRYDLTPDEAAFVLGGWAAGAAGDVVDAVGDLLGL